MDNKKKVMIVEDDAVLVNALTLSLEDEGYDISVATDGEEAEKMIFKEKPDLVLLDLLLPIKSGFEILKMMRENPETKDISVVILTNFEQETSIDEGMRLGAKDYIVKANIDIKDIPTIVKKILTYLRSFDGMRPGRVYTASSTCPGRQVAFLAMTNVFFGTI